MFHARILRYLDEVVRAGSIRQAAERLNVASSAVNRQILALEDELGTPIFQRLPRGLRLTAAGEILIAHVRQTLREHERAQARILDLRGLRGGTVKIATMNGLAGGLLPRVATEFRQKYPGVKIAVSSLFADQILKAVVDAEADVGLGYNLRSDPSAHVIEVYESRLGAIMSPTHPLAAAPGVRLADCARFPIVLADPSLTIHRIMHAAFQRVRLRLEPAFETSSIEFMKYVARKGEAITFLSAPDVSEDARAGELIYAPILDRSLDKQPLALIQRANTSLDPAPSLFCEMLRSVLKQTIQNG